MVVYDFDGNIISDKSTVGYNLPTIEYRDKALSSNGSFFTASGYGVTPIIPLSTPRYGIGTYTIVYYLKHNEASQTTYIGTYSNGKFIDYFRTAENAVTRKNIGYSTDCFDQIRLSVPLDGIDDSYCYVEQTGQILFAGKNTEYYGQTDAYTAKAVDALGSNYINVLKTSYAALVSETEGQYNRIPFIAYTDVHQKFDELRNVLKAVNQFCDLDKISRILQLGDNGRSDLFASAVSFLPLNKQINIPGNHDTEGLNPIDDHSPVMKYYRSGEARQFNKNEWLTIVDDSRNVKYIVINNLEMPTQNNRDWHMSTAQVRWFVNELEKADGYDIILLSHCHLDDINSTKRDGTTDSGQYIGWPWSSDTDEGASFLGLIAARKQKTNGTYTDRYGDTVSYDFTNCNSELLILFSGHKHTETYKNLPNSICNYIFECFAAYVGTINTIYFGYIDRAAKKFKNWKLYDGITAVDVQEIDIN